MPQDYAEAMKWYRKAAEQDIAEAQYNLGVMYDEGRGVSQNHAEAVKWYQKAAEQGLAEATDVIRELQEANERAAAHFEAGKFTAAFHEFMALAEHGDARSQAYLGMMYLFGLGVPSDEVAAVKWLDSAADQRDVTASFIKCESLNLEIWEHPPEGFGWCLVGGRSAGSRRSITEAVAWLHRAADQGSNRAQALLGNVYRTGIARSDWDQRPIKKYTIVPQDYGEAMRWYQRAADKGYAPAGSILGDMYFEGEGVPQDYAEAVKWFRLAATQGFAPALSKLGKMYENGYAVPRDPVRAYALYSLAVARDRPGFNRNNSVKSRDRVAGQLSSQQLSSAQELARRWYGVLGSALPSQFPEPSVPPPPSSDRVAEVQENLATLGYQPGSADGVLGPKTRAAIRAFQADHDRRETGEVSEDLRLELWQARLQARLEAAAAKQTKLEKHSTGSGFAVSREGHVLTSHHVVEGCREVRVTPDSAAKQLASDAQSDLSVLKVSRTFSNPATFREEQEIRLGDTVVVAGFPLHGFLASDLGITTGIVSALAGPGDDRRLIQITAPVQPGNSGGPLLDHSGNVVGVVVAKLDALKVAGLIGDIPQNVNFATSVRAARAFLDAHSIPYETAQTARGRDRLDPADVAAHAREFTLLIECWK